MTRRQVAPLTVPEMQVALGMTVKNASRAERERCRKRGHRSAGLLYSADNQTDGGRVSVTQSWTCVACGLRFSRGFSVPRPDCAEAKANLARLVEFHQAALHLDVLYELNLGRWERGQKPVRVYHTDDAEQQRLAGPALRAMFGRPATIEELNQQRTVRAPRMPDPSAS